MCICATHSTQNPSSKADQGIVIDLLKLYTRLSEADLSRRHLPIPSSERVHKHDKIHDRDDKEKNNAAANPIIL